MNQAESSPTVSVIMPGFSGGSRNARKGGGAGVTQPSAAGGLGGAVSKRILATIY